MKISETYQDNYDPYDDDWDVKTSPVTFEGVHHEQIEELVRRVNSITLKEEVAPTVISALQLHMFNFLFKHPQASDEDILLEFTKIQRLSEKENEASHINNPLPTIGIEIEIPDNVLTPEKIDILNKFDISNKEEGSNLWEVNPDYSYTAEVQARIIQELGHLGALRVEDPLSLHVNFGMPTGLVHSVLDKYQDEIILINDLLIYGFVSEERILKRKTKNSFSYMGTIKESEKSKGGYIPRIELRACEFKDYPSFRMLSESQKLMAMFISHIKSSEKLPGGTFVEERLADLWNDFKEEVGEYLKKEGAGANAIDTADGVGGVIDALRYTEIKEKSRSLISEYARKVSQIMKETGDY